MLPIENFEWCYWWNCVNLNHDDDDDDDDDDPEHDHVTDEIVQSWLNWQWSTKQWDELLYNLGRAHGCEEEKVKPSLQMVGYATSTKNWNSIWRQQPAFLENIQTTRI